MRPHEAGSLREGNVGERVTVAGWVQRRRDHGGIAFIDVRDATGLIQVVADPTTGRPRIDATTPSTRLFCRRFLKRFGVECTIVPYGDYAALEAGLARTADASSGAAIEVPVSAPNPNINA